MQLIRTYYSEPDMRATTETAPQMAPQNTPKPVQRALRSGARAAFLLGATLAFGATASAEPQGFLETLHRHSIMTSAVPDNGDQNPYALVVAPVSAGKIEQGDESPRASALREAAEEIGLDRDHIEPLGYLDLYMTTFGFRIVPVVARVRPGFSLTLNTSEVDATFEVPLAFLMDQSNVQRHSRVWQGMTRHYYAITFGERYIWGVTAGILRNLYDRIYAG